jgi:hypothetical protein
VEPLSSPPPLPQMVSKKSTLSPVSAKPVLPTWLFNVAGSFQIDASTNLTDWWPLATVYNVTFIKLVSDTVTKQPAMYYRLQIAP